MSAVARIHRFPTRRPTAASSGITVAQFRALMTAIRELPDRIADTMEQRGNVPSRIDRNEVVPLHCDDDFFL